MRFRLPMVVRHNSRDLTGRSAGVPEDADQVESRAGPEPPHWVIGRVPTDWRRITWPANARLHLHPNVHHGLHICSPCCSQKGAALSFLAPVRRSGVHSSDMLNFSLRSNSLAHGLLRPRHASCPRPPSSRRSRSVLLSLFLQRRLACVLYILYLVHSLTCKIGQGGAH